MKRNMTSFWIALIVTAILGSLLVESLQSAFGIGPVFVVASIICFAAGIGVIVYQIATRKKRQAYNAARQQWLDKCREREQSYVETDMTLER